MIDAYDAVMASPRLAFVKVKDFGDETELDKLGANPRVIWIPTRDHFRRADTLGHVPTVINGQRVEATSILLRAAGADIHLFTDYGPDGHRQMKWLINELHMALHEELLAFANYEIGDAQWFPRGALSQKSIEVVQPIRVYVPIWSAQPAQLLGGVTAQ